MKKIRLVLPFLALFFLTACPPDDNLDYSISLDKTIVEMYVGDTLTLHATAHTAFEWLSENDSVATVFHGIVTCEGEGQTRILAQNSKKMASCVVIGTKKSTPEDTVTVEHGEYQLVWQDEFDGEELDRTKWNVETGGGGWGNNELQYYSSRSDNLRVVDGHLEIEVRKEKYKNNEYTSARINTRNKADFTYGRVEARISLPAGRGTWPAFWMLGNGSWPKCGEIDIMEHIGSDPLMISHAVHTYEKNGMKGNNWWARWYTTEDNPVENEYHVYAIEWKKRAYYGVDCIYFYVDGKRTGLITARYKYDDAATWPFFEPEFIILNCAVGGNMGGSVDNSIFDNQDEEPIIMKVDYVRVYQKEIY